MDKNEILRRVAEFSELEDWNHSYNFPFNIQTKKILKNSPGNNVEKWQRLVATFDEIDLKDKSVIDIGCSDGYYSLNCARMGAKKVLGVDLDNLRIERAKFSSQILNVDNVKFENLDIYSDALKGTKFDIVLALGVLHRVPDIFGFLKRITELGETVVLEFKTSNSHLSICEWGGAKSKVNEFNNLYFLPSTKLVTDILDHFNFETLSIHKDRKSNLKYKRTILVAKKKLTKINKVFYDYKNKHAGQRVFLVGNGPSLAETDMNLLKDEKTIAMNRISLIYPKATKWRPTYYLFSSTNVKDENWGEEWLSSVHSAISEPETVSFIASEFKEYIDPNDKFPGVKWFDSLSENRPNDKGEVSKSSFSTNIIERIDKSGTSMNLALQLAYHMGFSEIVLIGADLGWTKDTGSRSDPNHFDKNYRANISNPFKANHQMRNIHRLAKSVFKNNKPEVKLYNASVKTVLDAYPIIDFKDYIKNNIITLRTEDAAQAKQFWESQIYNATPKKSLLYRGLRKIKHSIKRLAIK